MSHLLPPFRIYHGCFLLSVEGVDDNLSRVVGTRCTSHKVNHRAISQSCDGVTWRCQQVETHIVIWTQQQFFFFYKAK